MGEVRSAFVTREVTVTVPDESQVRMNWHMPQDEFFAAVKLGQERGWIEVPLGGETFYADEEDPPREEGLQVLGERPVAFWSIRAKVGGVEVVMFGRVGKDRVSAEVVAL